MKRLIALFLLAFGLADAANICVGPASTGSGSGADWSNIKSFTSFSNTWTRGNIYYLRDSDGTNYSISTTSFNATTALSGVTTIEWRKATVADHGVSTGWSDSMGDSTAIFDGTIGFKSTGYFILNGYSLGVGNYNCGIVVLNTTANTISTDQIDIWTNVDHVTVQYVEAYYQTSNDNYAYITGVGKTGIYLGTSTNTLISRCYIHGCDSLIYLGGGGTPSSLTIDNCMLQASRSSNNQVHENVVFCTRAHDSVFSNNTVWNYNAEGFFLTGFESPPYNWKIYNNTFWLGNSGSTPINPRGIELRQDYNYSGIEIIGNTFVDVGIGAILNRTAETGNTTTGCSAINNIQLNSAFSLGDFATKLTNTAVVSTIWTNYATGNFHLASDTATWTSQSSPYNVDKDGVTRTSSQGAYQYLASGAPTFSSASINSAGTSLTDVFSISTSVGAGGSGGMKVTCASIDYTATYASGAPGTSLVYTIAKAYQGATFTVTYTQPTNGLEATTGGADVVSFTAQPVTNNSTQVIPAPTSPSATATGSSTIDVNWTDASSGVTSFIIYRSLINGSFVQVGTAAAGVTVYHDSGLAQATQYYYVVASTAQGLTSTQTSSVNATTTGSGTPTTSGSLGRVDLKGKVVFQ